MSTLACVQFLSCILGSFRVLVVVDLCPQNFVCGLKLQAHALIFERCLAKKLGK